MKNNEKIKIGCLVSYDYKYFEYSLPVFYKHADIIVLAIDKDRLTWSGQLFEIPVSFFDWIKSLDIDNKIEIYEDSFYNSELTTMECDTRERNMLANRLGIGGWHIQIDSDEYFLDFGGFVHYLKTLDSNKSHSIFAEWITIFKQKESEIFLIDSKERVPIATNRPIYSNARFLKKDKDVKEIYSSFKILHHSWGRSVEELEQKLANWSHNKDFDVTSYFNLWKVIDRYNYKFLHNFHPLDGVSWKALECIEASTIPELIASVKVQQKIKKEEENGQNSFFNRLFRKKNK